MEKGVKRVFCFVVDSFGIGGAIDANQFGDEGSDTYKAICENIKIPNLQNLGLNNIDGIDILPKSKKPIAKYARLEEISVAKDTVTGHWEMMGIETKKTLPTYPNGFPQEVVEKLEKAFQRKLIGNFSASGTEIIKQLGDESTRTGSPILYTSADSVLQLACNEDEIPLEEIYDMCQKARELMTGEHAVSRVIARPFRKGIVGYYRTGDRKDYALLPPNNSTLVKLKNKGFDVIGVGKIFDIFSGVGLTKKIFAHQNLEVYDKIFPLMRENFNGFVFVNLVDTDMNYGHRNDVGGYRLCVEEFDVFLGKFIELMKDDDVLIVTADHGCDPSTPSTDHSRENVPYLQFQKNCPGENLGTIKGFKFVGETVEKLLGECQQK